MRVAVTVLMHHARLWHALRAAHPGGCIVTRCLIGIDYVPVRIATAAIPVDQQCPACRRELARDAREEIEIVEVQGGEAGGA